MEMIQSSHGRFSPMGVALAALAIVALVALFQGPLSEGLREAMSRQAPPPAHRPDPQPQPPGGGEAPLPPAISWTPEEGQEEWGKLTPQERRALEGEGVYLREPVSEEEAAADAAWQRLHQACSYTQEGKERRAPARPDSGTCSQVSRLLRDYLDKAAEAGVPERDRDAAVCYVEQTCCPGIAARFSRDCE